MTVELLGGNAVGVTVELSGGTCRGDCGAVGGNAVGVTVELSGGTCRGDCGAVGRNAVGEAVGCEDAVGVSVV